MNGDWFYLTKYKVFSDGGKATKRSPSDNLTKKGIGKKSRSVRA